MRPRRLSMLLNASALAVLLLAPPASASDGALEIHQACVASGCFPGDPPGFPVLISENGSYVLTSNLGVPNENTTAIHVAAEFATVDLGGFTISGVTQCGGFPPACSPTGSGVGIDVDAGVGVPQAVSVRDGVIAGMGNDGVRGLGSASVERLTVYLNGGRGIAAELARDNRVTGNAGVGIEALDSVVGNDVAFNHGAGISCLGATVVRGNTVRSNGIVTDGPGILCHAGVVLDNRVSLNLGAGLEAGVVSTVAYGNNVFQGNNDPATPANQVIGQGIQMGPSVCEGALCP